MLAAIKERMPDQSAELPAQECLPCSETDAGDQIQQKNNTPDSASRQSIWGKWWIFPLLFVAFSLFSKSRDVAPLFVFVMMLWGALVIYALHDLQNRAGYLIFLVAFFLFLLGGEFFELYFGYAQDFNFIAALDTHSYIVLLVSLGFLQVGYWGADQILRKRKETEPKLRRRNDPVCLGQLQKLSKVMLYVTALPLYVTTLDAVLYTVEHGYLSYYTAYQCRVPAPVVMVGELFPMFFFLFLAGFPAKKECLPPMGIYMVHGCLAILTGRRIGFGVAVLVLLFYVLLRHFKNKEENWIDRRLLLYVAVVCPLMLLALYKQRYLRYGEEVQGKGLVDMVCRFFSQQGSSIRILRLQKEVEGDPLGCTSLYYTLHYLRGNVITRHFFNFPMDQYIGRTVERAMNTNCLADYIMYKVNASEFFAGHGLGTSYIAELNHDLGLVGVALGSAVYGFLLNWLYSPKYFSYWKFALGLMMLEEFVILPRYGADVILRPFYNFTRTMVLVALFVLVIMGKERVQQLMAKFGIDKLFHKVQSLIPVKDAKRKKGTDDADNE